MAYLWRVLASVITAARVVSLPVPAVVGTAIKSGSFFRTFKIPASFPRGFPGLTIQMPAALAQSMLDPPPKPMMQSQPAFR